MQKLKCSTLEGKPRYIYYILIFGGKIKRLLLSKMKMKIAFKYSKESTH